MKLSDFGLRNGINEAIVVTFGVNDEEISNSKQRNTAPIGIIVEDEEDIYAKVRLYNNHTRKNVEMGSKIYANICFDPIIFAISAFEDLDDEYFADEVTLKCCYSLCVFEVYNRNNCNKDNKVKEYKLRLLRGSIVNEKAVRAFNRGFAAVVECAVHATRFVESRSERLKNKIIELGKIVERCGNSRDKEAYNLILNYAGLL